MTAVFPTAAISRLRMATDGEGITTLVCAWGCPLRCKYCLNKFTWDENTKVRRYTPQELYDKVRLDSLYFEATGGGVTFGGGEPLLYADFSRNSVHCAVQNGNCMPKPACVYRRKMFGLLHRLWTDLLWISKTQSRIFTGHIPGRMGQLH